MTQNQQQWDNFVLLLIDIQNDFWTEEMAEYFPDFSKNVSRLLKLCRTEGVDIVHLRASFKPDQSDWIKRYTLKNSIPCIEGTVGAEILPCAAHMLGERVIYKQTFDGFLNQELVDYLEENEKRFVLVAGLESSVCILLTAISATQHNYLSAVVSDCCADNPTAHQHVINNYPFAFDCVPFSKISAHYTQWQDMLTCLDDHEK
ncbi:MAG: nicotinamidase-related amidase [Candidatus Promineifilaceae bacterium]|jgi:nicotinamidase-related amidase